MEGITIKKIVIFFLIILFIIGGFLIYKSDVLNLFSNFSEDDIKTEEIIKTNLGDEFLFKYWYNNFPESQTSIDILDKKNNKKIVYFVIEDKIDKTDLICLVNTSNIRCYEVYNMLIYKVTNDNFEYADINQIHEMEPRKYQSLVQVCKALVDRNEWRWIKACAKFLINSGNSDIVNRLQNYANGQFTQDEIKINKNSDITEEEIQSFSKQLLDSEKIIY